MIRQRLQAARDPAPDTPVFDRLATELGEHDLPTGEMVLARADAGLPSLARPAIQPVEEAS